MRTAPLTNDFQTFPQFGGSPASPFNSRTPLDWRLSVLDGKFRGETYYASKREALNSERAARRAGSTKTEVTFAPGKAHRLGGL